MVMVNETKRTDEQSFPCPWAPGVGLWAGDGDGQGVEKGSSLISYGSRNATLRPPLGLTDLRWTALLASQENRV